MRNRLRLLLLACLIGVVVVALATPRLLRWRLAASEISAPQDLQHIAAAIEAYASEHGTLPPTLSSLRGRVVPSLACEAPTCNYRCYRFRYSTFPPEGDKMRYALSAKSLLGGGHSFYLDQTGTVRMTAENREATKADPAMR